MPQFASREAATGKVEDKVLKVFRVFKVFNDVGAVDGEADGDDGTPFAVFAAYGAKGDGVGKEAFVHAFQDVVPFGIGFCGGRKCSGIVVEPADRRGAVERVVDVRARHRELAFRAIRLESVAYLNVVDEDGRCFGLWEPAVFAELLDEVVGPDREVLLLQPRTFRLIGAVGLVESALRLVGMHVAAVVAPACRLVPKSQLDGVVEAVPSGDDRFGRERTAMGERLLCEFVEAVGEDALLHQMV